MILHSFQSLNFQSFQESCFYSKGSVLLLSCSTGRVEEVVTEGGQKLRVSGRKLTLNIFLKYSCFGAGK